MLGPWAHRKVADGCTFAELEASAIGLGKVNKKRFDGYKSRASAFQDRVNRGYDRTTPLPEGPPEPVEPENRIVEVVITGGDRGIWESVLTVMKSKVTRPVYETWLRDTVGVGMAGPKVLVVGVPSEAVAHQLDEGNISGLVWYTTKEIGGEIELYFRVMSKTEATIDDPRREEEPRVPTL